MENSTTLNDFYLYLLSPESTVEVEDSCISVAFSHPKTDEPLTGLEPTITIADKKTKSLELIGTMEPQDGRYTYCVEKKKWLVTPKPRKHIVYLDLGELKHLRVEIKVTESGEIESSD